MAERDDLLDLGGEDDQRHTLAGELAEHAVEGLPGGDVDAAGGIVEEEEARVVGEPAGEQHLLLVAARQRGDRRPRVGRHDRQLLVELLVAREAGALADQPAADVAADGGDGEVVEDRQRREDAGRPPVAGKVGDAVADGLAEALDAGRGAAVAHHHLAAPRRRRARPASRGSAPGRGRRGRRGRRSRRPAPPR